MHVLLEGKLAMVEKPEPFADENGKPVEYFVNSIKTPEGEVLVVNSKDSYEEHEGKSGVFKLRVRNIEDAFRRSGGVYRGLSKLALGGFVEAGELPIID